MQKIKFILDAAGDLTHEDIKGKPITICPARVHIDGRPETRDLFGITPQEYWEVLKTCKISPHTSMAPPIEWMTAYKEAYEQGYTHVIMTTVSSTGSGVFDAASSIAVGMLREEGIHDLVVEPIDSLGYSAMYGHAFLKGAEMAEAGASFDEICAKIREIFNKVEAMFSVYTLKYLKASGRINGVAAFAGEALGIRPVLLASGGSINPIDKVRGDGNVIKGVLSNLKKRYNANDQEQQVHIIHADVSEEIISELEEGLKENFGIENPKRVPLGSSITTNTGPTSIGVVYYGNPR
ncbi:MAG: DegV family protein [Oscillospiraceae bacterium]|nr:DegV family protein [Oscillospiraceae bacterium]